MESRTVVLDTEKEGLASKDTVILNSSRITGIMVQRHHENTVQKWCIRIMGDNLKLTYTLEFNNADKMKESEQHETLMKLAAKLEHQLWDTRKLEVNITAENYGL